MLIAETVIAGRYRLRASIGEGGMGLVWAGYDLHTSCDVALKFAKDTETRPDRQRRFIREARAAMKIDHPNVVRIYQVVAAEDAAAAGTPPFMVMDLLVGESLEALLARRKRLSLGEVADLMVQVVSAVGAAHAIGIVHRDLKPANIFLLPGGDLRVLDFGIAKFTGGDLGTASTQVTETGELIGTPQYMSPEQVFGERDLDHRTDIWSIGVIAYECFAGCHPIRGENMGQLIKAITATAVPPLGGFVEGLPVAVERIVERMLSRSPLERPQDLREVLEVFREHASVAVPSFAPPGGTQVTDAIATGEELGTETADDAPRRAGRGRRASRAVLWTGLLGLAVVCGGALVKLRGSDPSKPAALSGPTAPPTPALPHGSIGTVAVVSASTVVTSASLSAPVSGSAMATGPASNAVKIPAPRSADAGTKKVLHDEDI